MSFKDKYPYLLNAIVVTPVTFAEPIKTGSKHLLIFQLNLLCWENL